MYNTVAGTAQPFDLELLASLCGFRVEYTAVGERQDGWIDGWQRRILINVEMHELRQRFTLAHEIAHTLPDFGSGASSVSAELRVIASIRGGGKPLFLKHATVPAASVIHRVCTVDDMSVRNDTLPSPPGDAVLFDQ